MIEKNDGPKAGEIGTALAKKGCKKEAKEIAMNLIERNWEGFAMDIRKAIANNGDEANEIFIKLMNHKFSSVHSLNEISERFTIDIKSLIDSCLIIKEEITDNETSDLSSGENINKEPVNAPEGLQNNNAIGKSCCTIS